MRRGRAFEVAEPDHGGFARTAAHFLRWLQAAAERRPFGPAEDLAPVIVRQLYASHPRRFSVGHTGYRAGNGRRRATGAAIRAAIYCGRGGAGIHRGGILPVFAGAQPIRDGEGDPGAVVEGQVVAGVGMDLMVGLPRLRELHGAAVIDQLVVAAA